MFDYANRILHARRDARRHSRIRFELTPRDAFCLVGTLPTSVAIFAVDVMRILIGPRQERGAVTFGVSVATSHVSDCFVIAGVR
jgi:hypothetical protein